MHCLVNQRFIYYLIYNLNAKHLLSKLDNNLIINKLHWKIASYYTIFTQLAFFGAAVFIPAIQLLLLITKIFYRQAVFSFRSHQDHPTFFAFNFMIQKKIYPLLLLVSTLVVGACDGDDDQKTVAPSSTIVRLAATLDGAQQVPAVQTTASGEFGGTYNKETRELAYKIDYRGMTPSAGHLHYGVPGTTGSVAVTFPQYAMSPIEDTITLSPGDGQKLISEEMYVNLHSATHRPGELRGNIMVVP